MGSVAFVSEVFEHAGNYLISKAVLIAQGIVFKVTELRLEFAFELGSQGFFLLVLLFLAVSAFFWSVLLLESPKKIILFRFFLKCLRFRPKNTFKHAL